jgi:Domain of unknown function (DUF4333)
VLACALTILAACSGGSSTLDGKEIERRIGTQLRRDFAGASVGAAKCPAQIKKKTGKQVTCTAAVGNEPVPITVTQTDRDPGFRIVREVAVLDVGKVQAFVQTQYDQQVGVQVTAACAPGKTVLVAKPQMTIPCTVTDSQGTTDTVQVLVSDTSGNIKISTI